MDLSNPEVLTLAELADKYPNQWMGVRVVERDSENGQPLTVEIICRNADLYSVRSQLGTNFCTIFTGPIPEVKHGMML